MVYYNFILAVLQLLTFQKEDVKGDHSMSSIFKLLIDPYVLIVAGKDRISQLTYIYQVLHSSHLAVRSDICGVENSFNLPVPFLYPLYASGEYFGSAFATPPLQRIERFLH